MKKKTFIIILIYFSHLSFSQLDKWETLFSYQSINSISSNQNKLIINTGGNLAFFNASDQSIRFLNKKNGLSDNHVKHLYSLAEEGSFILYSNFNIDILDTNFNVINIPEVKNFSTQIEKKLNAFFLHKRDRESYAYLACNFGLVAIDLNRLEVYDSYLLNEKLDIKDICIKKDNIYLLLEDKIVVNKLESNKEIDNWELAVTKKGIKGIEIANNKLYTYSNDTVFRIEENDLKFEFKTVEKITQLKTVKENLVVLTDKSFYIKNNSWAKYPESIEDITDFENELWLTQSGEIKKLVNPEVKITINSSSSNKIKEIETNDNGELLILDSNNNIELYNGFSWKQIETNPSQEIELISSDKSSGKFLIIAHDKEHQYYELENELLSHKKKLLARDKNTIVSGMYSKNGKQYFSISNSNSANILISDYNQILKFSSNLLTNKESSEIQVDNNGYIWINCSKNSYNSPAIVVFDPINNRSIGVDLIDNDLKNYRQKINQILVDKYNQMWICFEGGVLIFTNTREVFNSNITATKIYKDGESQFLLEGKTVQCMAIDGANQKWFGTKSNGVFVVSSAADSDLYHFDMGNSLLPSNNIEKITIDNKTSKAFFATDKGIVSYHSDYTKEKKNLSSAKVYPNPIKYSKDSHLFIKNLVDNSEIIITNLSGEIIHQGFANGGTYRWDLLNYKDEKQKPGIYLIYCNANEGGEKTILKFAIL